MSLNPRKYIVNNISLPVDASFEEAFSVVKKKFRKIGINAKFSDMRIYRRSVDARKKNDIRFVYSVVVGGSLPNLSDDLVKKEGLTVLKQIDPIIVRGNIKINSPIVVVGSGPCGLFSALILAENGYPVVLLEKGGSVNERKQAVEKFKKDRILDENTNIQFGAGGAGTFSDGKLVTRINDDLSSYTIKRFIEFGGPQEIEFLAKPHIGTDILSKIVENIISRITELGGKVMYHTELLDFTDCNGIITSCLTSNGTIDCSALVLAVGHSARKTYQTMFKKEMDIVAKDFSVGMRIEHQASSIDDSLYGDFAGHPKLGHAEYNLSTNTKTRGVYTFCMCPGGEVVAAASESGGVVVNGMSHHARNGSNSNSAVLCSVFKSDYGATPSKAIEFQRMIERSAFKVAGSNYSAPITYVGDFLNLTKTNHYSDVVPTYMDGCGVTLASPNDYLPEFVVENIKNALFDFDKKIKGFASPKAILTGPETRTSAPLRILRSNDELLATGYTNLYPAGEGAGYAGGITSAAIDGIKVALKIIEKYTY